MIEAHPNGCQEAALNCGNVYLPCNRPATHIVGWKGRSETPIRMCDFCTEHNVHNRNGEIVSKIDLTEVAVGRYIEEHAHLAKQRPVQLDLVTQVEAVKTAEQLIEETVALKDKIKKADEQYAKFCSAWKEKIKENENKLLALLNEQNLQNVRSDSGTAFKSVITSYKVVDRDTVLKLILDNWQDFGNEMLMFNVQADAVKKYVQEHGRLPEGITSDSFVRVNIRRS